MKLLHVITGLGTGGAETALCRLLESLPSQEYQHTVVTLGNEGALGSRAVAAGAHLVCLRMRSSAPSPSALWRLRRIIRDARPDVIHGWMYHANVAASAAACGVGLPVVWGIRHSLYILSEEKPLTRVVIRAGAIGSAQPAAVVYNARISAKQHEALGYRNDKTRIIPNGFDTNQFRPDARSRAQFRAEVGAGSESLTIGMVARLHPMKDHDTFLRAAALFACAYPKAVFILVGAGLEATNGGLVDYIGRLGLADRVRLCGRRSDVATVNAGLDIASCSSWSEAFPNAVGEAMACGVPCVATDVGDVRDIVGDTGVVVPPRDPEALCAGWIRLAELGAEGRRALGERARQRVIEHYGLATVSRQYVDLYRQARGD